MLFEDHKNVWVFQKCLHSTIVMCEGGAQKGVANSFEIIKDVINQNETNPARNAKLQSELVNFLGQNGSGENGFPSQGLDVKSRDEFQPIFNKLK